MLPMSGTPLGEESIAVGRNRSTRQTRRGTTVYEYEIYRQRSAELQAAAAHERLVAEARRVARARTAAGGEGTVAARLGRLTAGLRRAATHTDRATAEC
jgi:hypothetical protein